MKIPIIITLKMWTLNVECRLGRVSGSGVLAFVLGRLWPAAEHSCGFGCRHSGETLLPSENPIRFGYTDLLWYARHHCFHSIPIHPNPLSLHPITFDTNIVLTIFNAFEFYIVNHFFHKIPIRFMKNVAYLTK